jgi:uncharacterized protein (DUF342 family)
VIAHRKIVLQGRRAVVSGGHLFATEEINAKTIGTSREIATIGEAGYNIKLKQQLDTLTARQIGMAKSMEEFDVNIRTMNNARANNQMTPEKEMALADFIEKKETLTQELNAVTTELRGIRRKLQEDAVDARIAVSDTTFPGVTILLRDARMDLKNEVKAASFTYKDGAVNVTKYVPSSMSVKRS